VQLAPPIRFGAQPEASLRWPTVRGTGLAACIAEFEGWNSVLLGAQAATAKQKTSNAAIRKRFIVIPGKL
jgi:hypothetical protein